MGYIYKITNKINGKMYVGKTNSYNPHDRFNEHILDSRKDRCKNRPLYRAFNKYGVDNFNFEVIEQTENTEEREKYYIELYGTYGSSGYNATKGGDGKVRLSLNENEVISYHISDGNYMVYRTSKRFSVDPKTIIVILDKNNIKRLTRNESDDFKKLNRNKVKQIDITTNEVINIFNSVADANSFFNKERSCSSIYDAVNGVHKTAYGYLWELVS